jgi:hypothetical protein
MEVVSYEYLLLGGFQVPPLLAFPNSCLELIEVDFGLAFDL